MARAAEEKAKTILARTGRPGLTVGEKGARRGQRLFSHNKTVKGGIRISRQGAQRDRAVLGGMMLRKLIRVAGYLIVAALIGYIGYSIGNGDKCVECYQSGIVRPERVARGYSRFLRILSWRHQIHALQGWQLHSAHHKE